jgi:hypothetical protein
MARLASASILAATIASLGVASAGCGAVASRAQSVASAASATASSDRTADLCAGLPEVEHERPSFLRTDGIEAVHPVTAERSAIKFGEPELLGAAIVLRPRPTVTKPWVARVLRCHLADPVAVALSDRFGDPLTVGEPAVSVDETPGGLVVRIAGQGSAQGEEILRRAEQLHRSE